MNHTGDDAEKTWCISEVDIFRDLSEAEMDAIAAAAPMKTVPRGQLNYTSPAAIPRKGHLTRRQA